MHVHWELKSILAKKKQKKNSIHAQYAKSAIQLFAINKYHKLLENMQK